MIWYPKCKEKYHAFGCCICVQDKASTPNEEPELPPPPPDNAGIPESAAAPIEGVNDPTTLAK